LTYEIENNLSEKLENVSRKIGSPGSTCSDREKAL
jgi:hypothetical protein